MGTLNVTWEGAYRSFLLHKKATTDVNTVRFYRIQLAQFIAWATTEGIALTELRERHHDEYIGYRKDCGRADTTVRSDSLCLTVFIEWCAKHDYLPRDPLSKVKPPKAAPPFKYMPSEEDLMRLVRSVYDFWNPVTNPSVREVSPAKRDFHRDRNYALILILIDTACRKGEALSLKVADFRRTINDQREAEYDITIREAKGNESRTIPLSPVTAEAIEEWLKVRRRVMKEVPKDEDENWLFMSESGTRIMERVFSRSFQQFVKFAGLSPELSPHAVRRFSLNKLSKHSLRMAQAIAGHKDPKTTMIYTKLDPSYVRAEHQEVGIMRSLMQTKKPEKKKRLVR